MRSQRDRMVGGELYDPLEPERRFLRQRLAVPAIEVPAQ